VNAFIYYDLGGEHRIQTTRNQRDSFSAFSHNARPFGQVPVQSSLSRAAKSSTKP